MRHFLPFALTILLLSACAATPEDRIEKSQDVFAQLTPDQQEKVRAGKVEIGFDAKATTLALGKPDRITERTTAEGVSEVWQYLTVYSLPAGPCYGAYYRYGLPPYCFDAAPIQEVRERMRVNFTAGKIVSIEREKQ